MRRKRLIGLGSLGAGIALSILLMTQSGNNPFKELANSVMPVPEHQVADQGISGTTTARDEAQQVAQLRPAAPGPSPEEEALNKLPPPARPEHLTRPSQAELQQQCMQDPNCRQKLERFQKGERPSMPLPAATAPSPEEQELKKLPPPAQSLPAPRPRSEVIPGPTDSLFSWLDPFFAGLAEAQTIFSVYLTPQASYSSSPYAYLWIVGAHHPSTYAHYLSPGMWVTAFSYPNTENKPFVHFGTSFPTAGYYLVDVAGGNSLAKLRHLFNGTILVTWDKRNATCPNSVCHYVTVDYYAAGNQYWYFWAAEAPLTTVPMYFYSVTIEPYLK